MHPILFKIGSWPIHSYGALIAAGFIAASVVFRKLSERSKLNVDQVMDLVFWSFLIGFLGARTLYVITRWEDFASDPASIFRIWEGGLVFFGGPLAVVPFLIWYLRKHALPLWKTMDVLVPGIALAHAFGRLGCLAAGCCYGKPTGSEWGVKLDSPLVEESMRGIFLHPVQLYESAALLVLFAGLLLVYRSRRFDGQVVLTYFMAYPLIRSITELFRGDSIRGFVIDGWLSTSQFISAIVFLTAAVALFFRLKGRKSA